MNFERYIRIAKGIRPPEYNQLRFFHVCFITKNSSILSIGLNRFKTHTINKQYNTYVDRDNNNISDLIGTHAETSAIIQLGREDCSRYTFINIRLNLQNQTRYSAPCRGCFGILRQVGFRQIFYSTNNPNEFGLIRP